jgi:hypothetical protein
MTGLRVLAAGFGVLSLYYARFFLAVRQEVASVIQIGILLLAAGVLLVPARTWLLAGPARSSATSALRGLVALLGVLLAVSVFAWADHDSHSVSDTLTRAVPTLCLILAIVLRTVLGPGRRTRPEISQGRRPVARLD